MASGSIAVSSRGLPSIRIDKTSNKRSVLDVVSAIL
jgi:hypothetical protein